MTTLRTGFFNYLFLRRALRTREIPKNEIEEIDLHTGIGVPHQTRGGITVGSTTIGTASCSRAPAKNEIMIRSDKDVIRFGQYLGEVDKQWLVSALTRLGRGAS